MALRRRRTQIQVGWRVWAGALLGLTLANALLGLRFVQRTDCGDVKPRDTPPPQPAPLPSRLSPLSGDPRLARWDPRRQFRFLDHSLVGTRFIELSASQRVCLATQSSVEKLFSIVQVATNWAGPISAALYAAGDDEYRLLQLYVEYLWRCHPSVRERVSFHVAFPAERIPGSRSEGGSPTPVRGCPTAESLADGLLKTRTSDTARYRLRNPYPQNHLRNLARKNCHSPQVFLTDIDIIPVAGLAEGLQGFFTGGSECVSQCAYVVPTYELDEKAPFPQNKSHLLMLTKQGLARPFHQKVFIYNQYATNFSRWEEDHRYDYVHISHPVTNFEFLYEPFYVATDLVPAHDQRFIGYGFTRNTQVYEMFVAGFQFYVLSPVFTIHWGLQNRMGRPSWRERQNSNNRKNLDQFKRDVFAKYHKDPLNMLLSKPTRHHPPTLN